MADTKTRDNAQAKTTEKPEAPVAPGARIEVEDEVPDDAPTPSWFRFEPPMSAVIDMEDFGFPIVRITEPTHLQVQDLDRKLQAREERDPEKRELVSVDITGATFRAYLPSNKGMFGTTPWPSDDAFESWEAFAGSLPQRVVNRLTEAIAIYQKSGGPEGN